MSLINKVILKKLSVALFLLAIVSSCDVLDTDPANRIPESEAFADLARIQAQVIGVYQAAQQGYYLEVVQRGYPFGAASVQQNDMKGEDMYNDQAFYEITYTGSWTPTTANNSGMWISLYRLVNRCNVVIEGIATAVDAGVLTESQAAPYLGEMLYLRAMSHHELVIHFSRPYSDNPSALGVPYRDFAVNSTSKIEPALLIDRGTVASTYTRILQDLDMAETMLGSDIAPFRATKGAAIALKTRVKLHMKDWAGVLTEYDKIKASYSLAPTPEGPFRSGGATSENIFSLQHSDASNPGVNGALASMYGSPAMGARGLVKISPVIWNASFWAADDLRRTNLTLSSSTGIFTTKYIAYATYSDPTPHLRFAEVLLNAAEAHARLDELDDAVTLLNLVRDRSIPASSSTPSYTTADLGGNQAGVLQGVLNERRIEFLAEGRRFMDIHRLSGEGLMNGIPVKAQSRSINALALYEQTASINFDHDLPYTEDQFIWPIPIETIINNVILEAQQNPGY